MIAVAHIRVEPYALRFVRDVVTARGRFSHRRGWLLALEDEDGRIGHGDAASWPGFGSDSDRVAAELAELAAGSSPSALIGSRVERIEDIARLIALYREVPEVAFAVELALLDLLAQARRVRLAELLHPGVESEVACHHLVTDSDAAATAGFDHIKIKIGARSLDEDERRVAAVRSRYPKGTVLRLDAGGAYDESRACRVIERLAPYRIGWLEQPVAAHRLETMARVRAHAAEHQIAIAADESVWDAASLRAIVAAGAADAAVIKPMFAGGLLAARSLVAAAREAGLEAIVTHALESAIGRAGVRHLAVGLTGVHGLGNPFADDVAELPAPHAGRVEPPAGVGLGVAPDRATTQRTARVTAALHIPHPLQSAAIAMPERIAIDSPSGRRSYGELLVDARRMATALRGRGLQAGNVVALHGEQTDRWLTMLHALVWLGCTVLPMAPQAREQERAQLLALACPDAVLQPQSIDCSDAPMSTLVPERPWPSDERRFLIATSGSSAAPKLVPLTTGQLLFSAFGSALRLGHQPGDRWLCCLPLHHVGGLSIALRCMFYGTTMVRHDRFDAERVANALDSATITQVSLVPTMLARVLDARREVPFPDSLRAVLIGGAAATPALLERCHAMQVPVALSWGMSETASQIATREPGDTALPIDAGPPLAFARVSLSEQRLTVDGPLVVAPLVTSDLGAVTNGRVNVHGRADDVIVSGGKKIAPAEIEIVLHQHPAIADAVVAGVPHAKWGARPLAALTAADPRNEPAHDALARWCRERLSSHKVPDRFVWCRALPRTDIGKIARRQVAELLNELAAEGLLDEPVRAEPSEQLGRRGARGKALEAHKGVDQLSGGAHATIGAAQGVLEPDRALPQPVHLQGHVERVAQAHRSRKIGFSVHQRHTDSMDVKHGVDVEADGAHQLLVRRMAVLEHATEKHDPCAIRFEETSGDTMNERHDDDAR